MAEAPFGRRFVEAVAATSPLCAGLDPSAAVLGAWGLDDDAAGLARFAAVCVKAFGGVVGVVKPQVAFFERHGARGLAVLEQLVADARAAGLLVLADAKRGDVATTAAAYAEAWLDDASPLAADAVTVTPYVGLGALEPLVAAAAASGRGVFVVTRTSNPEGRPLQEARTAEGPSVEDAVLAGVAARNAERRGDAPLGPVGVVVGATLEPSAFALGDLGGPVLAPGLGAQGATPADVRRRFAGCPPHSVVVSASRSLLAAGPDPGRLAAEAHAVGRQLAEPPA